jgi:hypothetical protein
MILAAGVGGVILLTNRDSGNSGHSSASDSSRESEEPSDGPSDTPTPTATVLSLFVHQDLSEFAARGALNADECTAQTESDYGPGIDEAVDCKFAGNYDVSYYHHETLGDKVDFLNRIKAGFDGSFVVGQDTTWRDAENRTRGNWITGVFTASDGSKSGYVYWDYTDSPVHGALYTNNTSQADAEDFWSKKL